MLMFLLAPALVLLVTPGPAAAAPHPNLKRIIDLVGKYNDSLNKEFFVEDVQPLYEAGCGDKFFCKVQDVLQKHETVTKRKDEHELLRNLQVFTKHLSPMSCEQLLKDVRPTQPKVEIQIPKVIELLSNCIQRKNWNGDER